MRTAALCLYYCHPTPNSYVYAKLLQQLLQSTHIIIVCANSRVERCAAGAPRRLLRLFMWPAAARRPRLSPPLLHLQCG